MNPDDNRILATLTEIAELSRSLLDDFDGGDEAGERLGQYALDLVVDGPVVQRLVSAGFGVLSEESGLTHADRDLVVVVDPVDGSTNAARGIPFFATSMCVLDGDGPRVALVQNLATGTTWTACRGRGARRDGTPINTSRRSELGSAIVGVSGLPPVNWGWEQFRSLGSAALQLCMIADGSLDGFVDCSQSSHFVWDYLGGMLVLAEAGGVTVDAEGRDLVVRSTEERRVVVAAASEGLAGALVAARRHGEVPPG